MSQPFYILASNLTTVSVSQSNYFAPIQAKPRDIQMGIIHEYLYAQTHSTESMKVTESIPEESRHSLMSLRKK